MRTIGETARGRDNNFNLLRIVAAAGVLIAHCVELTRGFDYFAWWDRATGYTVGQAAVSVFFAVSGFFITKSFLTRRSLIEFGVARALRIYPGLFVVVVLMAFVLGPLVTTLPIAQYFGENGLTHFLAFHLSMRPNQHWDLPGVFGSNPYGNAVDGSLWTLRWEVGCYALVVFFGLIGLLGKRSIALVLALPLFAVLTIPQVIGGLWGGAAVLSLPFALGAAMYVWRDHIPVDGRLALGIVMLTVVARLIDHTAFLIMFALALSYGAMWFGLANIPGLRAYNRFGDYSYGLYIYAYPIQQTVVWALAPGSVELLLISLPFAAVFAVLSWKLVEEPALRHRHRVAAWLTRLTGQTSVQTTQ